MEATGADIGPASNYNAMLDLNQQFDFYNGGGLDVCFLGMGEVGLVRTGSLCLKISEIPKRSFGHEYPPPKFRGGSKCASSEWARCRARGHLAASALLPRCELGGASFAECVRGFSSP